MEILKKIQNKINGRTKIQVLAFIDFYFRKRNLYSCGGPFNGQDRRKEIFKDILNVIPFDAIIETGTYGGRTTEYLACQKNIPVHTVEINPRLFFYSRFKLRRYRNVHLYLNNSVQFLEQMGNDRHFRGEKIFFYLDAHDGRECLPLRDEVDLICSHFSEFIIMIDDFQVPGDPGYGFDDYGKDKRLTLDYLQLHRFPDIQAFFPMAPSFEETGGKKGSVVLVSKGQMLEKISDLKSLKKL